MNKTRRRLIFYLSLLAFGVTGWSLTFLAVGYNFDWQNYRWIKTGSISLKTSQKAEIFVNQKLLGMTSLLANFFSQDNLFPGEYQLKAQSRKRQSWAKTVAVQEGRVTDFPRVVLWPQSLTWEKIIERSEDFSLSPDGQTIAFAQKNQIIFVDLKKREIVFSLPLTEKLKSLPALTWSLDTPRLLIGLTPFPLLIDFHQKKVEKLAQPAFLVQDKTLWTEDFLYGQQSLTKNLQKYNLTNNQFVFLPFAVSSWKMREGVIWGLTAGDQPKLFRWFFQENGFAAEFMDLSLSVNDRLRLVERAEKDFYFLIGSRLYRWDTKKFWLLAEQVKEAAISPSGWILAWINEHNELWTIGIKENLYQPQRQLGEKKLLLKSDQRLSGLYWYFDSGQLIFQQENKIMALEEDNRGGSNLHLLEKIQAPDRFGYYAENNTLWLWRSGQLLIAPLN